MIKFSPGTTVELIVTSVPVGVREISDPAVSPRNGRSDPTLANGRATVPPALLEVLLSPDDESIVISVADGVSVIPVPAVRPLNGRSAPDLVRTKLWDPPELLAVFDSPGTTVEAITTSVPDGVRETPDPAVNPRNGRSTPAFANGRATVPPALLEVLLSPPTPDGPVGPMGPAGPGPPLAT
jgi:hypothetical protein